MIADTELHDLFTRRWHNTDRIEIGQSHKPSEASDQGDKLKDAHTRS